MEIAWRTPPDNRPLVGQSLAEINLRVRTSVSIVVLVRDGQVLANPKSRALCRARFAGLDRQSQPERYSRRHACAIFGRLAAVMQALASA